MGFLKDLRTLRKQAKETAAQSGVDTSLGGLLRSAPGMMRQATEALQQVAAGKERSDELRRTGVAARARLVAVRDTGMSLGGTALAAARENPVAELDLEVHREGHEPYAVTVRQLVPRLAVARLVPGTELPVLVDPRDRTSVLVDWEAPV